MYITLTAETVKPAFVVPIPDVKTERAATSVANFRNCDLAVPKIFSNFQLQKHNQNKISMLLL